MVREGTLFSWECVCVWGVGGVGEFWYFFVGPPWRFDKKKKTPDPPPIGD